MKRLFVLLMALCLLTVPALAESSKPATLTVTGSAVVSVKPDYAQVTIGTSTTDQTVEIAAQKNAEVLAAIREALLAIGLADDDITTESFNVNPNYDYSASSGYPTVNGYQVQHMLSVTIKDLDKLSTVLDAALTAGANQTYGVNLLSTHQAQAADKALENAIADGLRKAELAAKAAGKNTGELIAIVENFGGYAPVYGAKESLAMDAGIGTDYQTGMLEVSAVIQVTYELK